MASNRSTIIEFKSRDTVPGDEELRLEQEEYPDDEYLEYGCMTDAQEVSSGTSGVTYINSFMNALKECASHCTETGDFVARIRVYTEPFDLAYTPRVTHGTIGPQLVETTDYVDQVKWRLEKQVVLPKTLNNIEVEWEGPVMNSLGEEVPPPEVFIEPDNRTLRTTYAVYGVALVKGRDTHYVHEVIIPQREEGDFDVTDLKSIYDSTFMAFYSNKVADLDIKPPSIKGNCNYRVRIQMGDSPGDGSGDDDCWKKVITVDTCTGRIVKEEKIQVSCPETD